MSDETAPDERDDTPRGFAARLRGAIDRVLSYADQRLKPHESGRPSLRSLMEREYEKAFTAHVRRIEYQLRCFILWLAADLLNREVSLPEAPLRARKPFEPSTWIARQEKEYELLARDTPPIPSFSVLPFSSLKTPGARTGRCPRITRTYRALYEYDASPLLARITSVTRALKRADKIAERLAWRAKHPRQFSASSLEPALCDPGRDPGARELLRISPITQRAQLFSSSPEPVPCEPNGSRELRKNNPLFFEPFSSWVPPEAIYYSTEDPDERSDLSALHYRAASGLDKAGYSIPPPDELPALTRFQPPAIRSL